jgi:SAM-dependent methyltransferase
MQRFLVPCRLIKIFLMLRSLFFLAQVFKPGIFKLLQGQILREFTPEDELLRFIAAKWGSDGGDRYMRGGAADAGKIVQIIKSLNFRTPDLKILDFAAGFGRVTRHLSRLCPEAFVAAADIHPEACRFMSETLAIPAQVSTTNPHHLHIEDKYNFIFTLSFFSHLPNKTYKLWLGALYNLLVPGGYLFFTANGQATIEQYPDFFGGIFDPTTGFGLRIESDQTDLDGNDYGSAVCSMRYVLDALYEQAPQAVLQRFHSGGWCGTQDGWLVRKPKTGTP